LVGFENHGGRTYLGKNLRPLGKVLKGYGNNGKDKTEGIIYKNSIGTYLHGPVLPKNPQLADFLIIKALKNKYRENITLKKADDSLAEKARKVIAERLSVAI
jgi:CobQ-like glutamine amidotransferase family enzyme